MVTENTVASGIAAVACGADVVEFDVVRSTDGDFFVFHDGYEYKRFGDPRNMNSMTSGEIGELRYRLHGADSAPDGVATVAELLRGMPDDVLFNVDRSWPFWGTLLPYLDSFEMTERLILKCPPEGEHLRELAQHAEKYPLIPMVHTLAEIEFVGNYEGVNVVGFELLASDRDHPFTDPQFIAYLQQQGYLVFVNAINLENRVPLFAGWDDETSLTGNVSEGWGQLVDRGADIIQTDWPALLAHYLGKPMNFPSRDGVCLPMPEGKANGKE